MANSLIEYALTYALLIASCAAISLPSSNVGSEDNKTIKEVEEVFNKIEENHDKLRVLFRSIIIKQHAKDKECVCVPYYMCNNEGIITEGSDLPEYGATTDRCYSIGDIYLCCEVNYINMSLHTLLYSSCGYSSNLHEEVTAEDRTVKKFEEYPWTVMVLTGGKSLNGNDSYKCLGSLIHPQVVLTVAHCLRTTEKYIVQAGLSNENDVGDPVYQREVERVLEHPRFNRVNSFYNVALLILADPFELNEYVRTVCLAESAPDPLRTHPDECVVTEWSSIQSTRRHIPITRRAEFPLLRHQQCQDDFRKTGLGRWFELHQSFICASVQNGSDVCSGSEGSPLVCPVSEQPSRNQLVGIRSWSIDCKAKTPAVFTKISQIRTWIDEQFDILRYSKDYYTY